MINDFSQGMMSRRALLLGAAMSSALHAFAKDTAENAAAAKTKLRQPGEAEDLCLLQALTVDQHSAMRPRLRGISDLMALTLRCVPSGHVLPERVETDLPAAVEAVHRAGLQFR